MNSVDICNYESPFILQEIIQVLLNSKPHNLKQLIEVPDNQDQACWIYEHLRLILFELRQFCIDLGKLLVLQTRECTKSTCPEMKASGWEFICAAHATAQPCSAIDYANHTLDSSIALLTSSKHFPLRNCISKESSSHFPSICRRLYRIFAHAWFHHKEIFVQFEMERKLYERFIMLCEKYNLLPKSAIIIPPDYKESLPE